MRGRVFTVVLAAAALLLTTTACDPVPRPVLRVDSLDSGGDAVPGDGVCATTDGSCTLAAAIDEANATGSLVDIELPAGPDVPWPGASGYSASSSSPITGRVRIIAVDPLVQLRGHLVVAASGHLTLDGVNRDIVSSPAYQPSGPVTIDSAGLVAIDRSVLSALTISTGGSAVLQRSLVIGGAYSATGTSVVNDGTLVAADSTLLVTTFSEGDPSSPPIALGGDGTSHLVRTALAQPSVPIVGVAGGIGSCEGEIISYGLVHVEVPCASVGSPTDSSGDARTSLSIIPTHGFESLQVSLDPTSPLIDAIPVGEPGCAIGDVDIAGQPRGVDGNGDGIGGCDIGALERSPD